MSLDGMGPHRGETRSHQWVHSASCNTVDLNVVTYKRFLYVTEPHQEVLLLCGRVVFMFEQSFTLFYVCLNDCISVWAALSFTLRQLTGCESESDVAWPPAEPPLVFTAQTCSWCLNEINKKIHDRQKSGELLICMFPLQKKSIMHDLSHERPAELRVTFSLLALSPWL